MKAERWQQINDLFQSAAERAPEERASFLDEACHGDEGLYREVESLIDSYERAGNFIDSPAFEVAPELLTNDTAGALVGESIGHYRIESLIGVGGMGEVYLAQDELLGRKVALKFLPESLTADEAQLSRLEHEARTASALNHPNILTVHEIGVDGRRHYIATEFIEGETLRAVLARGKLDLRDALNIALQIGSALAAAHKSGVLHRDIKPENIMLRPDAYVKVLDFGIAKLSKQEVAPSQAGMRIDATSLQAASGLIFGTAHYMSPEQARGQTVDARSDIWSFGVVLFEMLAGRPPFEGKTPSECIAAVLKREPPLVALKAQQVPARVEQIVRKALRKDKEQRYQSVEEMLADLRRLKEVSESITSGWKQQKKITAFLAASVAVALVVAGLFIYLRPTRTVTNTLAGNASPLASVLPERSIAVLPFENRSEEKQNAFFADGVQDEILTNLARIADLKVISRSSVMQYKGGGARNLREIGEQLGVAHLLEGSVQRAANKIRVNAQLIDARTDAHLWAQTYDRDLADVFAIQSEIAKAIAEQLQAKLSPNEKAAIEKPPTTDLAAFDLYTRAKTLLLSFNTSVNSLQILQQAIELLNQAVGRDPAFFEAYYQLVYAHGLAYSVLGDHTPARLALAEAALQAATRLRPDAGETHLARANYMYYCLRDYNGALAELEVARRSLPNDPRLFESTGYILRRRGQREEGVRNLERAVQLDPRNSDTLQQLALSYQALRRYPEEAAVLDRALTIVPNDVATRTQRALVDFYWKAETRPLHETIDSILAAGRGAISDAADNWFTCTLAERDPTAAERALVALGDNPWWNDNTVILSRSFGEGLLARMMKDEPRAHAAFTKARLEQEKIVQAQPGYGPPLCVLGLIDAALGRKEEALREGRRAIEFLPVEKDSSDGSRMLVYFAIIAAWAGEKETALQYLAANVQSAGRSVVATYGALKLLPFWQPLRGDARFEKIVASLAPERVQKSAPDKSIAVLPFENLSRDPDNAFFTDGVHDEILTDLARIADLKVIGRTSVMQYKSRVARNLRKIGQQLGVTHLVEGSVQRSDNRVRVNAQLIDARIDRQLWGETYDRELADVFAIQSEIAKAIADQLQAKLSPNEKKAIEQPPTTDLAAFDLYSRAKSLLLTSNFSTTGEPDLRKAIELLDEAVKRDPSFFDAYCQLAYAHETLYAVWGDHTPARLALAEAAVQAATRLRPDAAETHLARAQYLYYGPRDYAGALAELEIVRRALPNDPRLFELTGYILRRRGPHEEGLRNLERAVELDPRNFSTLQQIAQSYQGLGRWAEAIAAFDRALAIVPDNVETRANRELYYMCWKADTRPLHQTIDAILAQGPSAIASAADIWFLCALAERDPASAERALVALGDNPCWNEGVFNLSRSFGEGLLARMTKDEARARTAFEAARTQQEKIVQAQPDHGPVLCVLGLIDAALGRKDLALDEGRRAIALTPLEKDVINGSVVLQYFAITAAWAGDKEFALQQLEAGLRAPVVSFMLSYGALKLFPVWDPLRGDPRFEQIVAALAPK